MKFRHCRHGIQCTVFHSKHSKCMRLNTCPYNRGRHTHRWDEWDSERYVNKWQKVKCISSFLLQGNRRRKTEEFLSSDLTWKPLLPLSLFSWYFLTKGIRDQCSDPHRSGISLISRRGLSYYRIKSNLPPAASVTDFTILVFTTAKATPPQPQPIIEYSWTFVWAKFWCETRAKLKLTRQMRIIWH